MDKPFKTIDEQLEILASRGVTITPDAEEALLREGYYSIVNGYKDLYLNYEKSAKEGHDVFDEGTSFDDIYGLFRFDRKLRQTLFSYFAKAEATLKTQCAYNYSEMHQNETEPYLNPNNYDPKENKKHVDWLITDFKIALGRHPKKKPKPKAYMEHYRRNHDEVPLWVLLRYMTLGQTFKFYCFQNESVRNSIAREFAELYRQSYGSHLRLSPRRLRLAFDHIKDFRNICAHGEQLYCARISPSRDVTISRAFSDLKLVLSKHDFSRLQDHFADLLYQAASQFDRPHFAKLLISMGFHRYDPRRKA